MTKKRFINDVDNGKLYDTKGEMYTIHYDDRVDFYSLWEFLNKLNDENEQLKQAYQTLKSRHSLLHDECLEAECDRDSLKKDVISLEKENEQLKKKILEEIDLEVAYVNETYSDGRMSKEQHNGAIISLRQLREKFE